MNERIREIARQAGVLADFGEDIKVGRWSIGGNYENMQRFAQLIVQECARVARATPCPYDNEELRQRLGHTWDMASLAAGQEIVTHFGVE